MSVVHGLDWAGTDSPVTEEKNISVDSIINLDFTTNCFHTVRLVKLPLQLSVSLIKNTNDSTKK